MRDDRPWVLGITASHNGSACLLRGDEIVVAVQEERLTRQKRASVQAGDEALCVNYCLDSAGITLPELSAVVFNTLGSLETETKDLAFSRALPFARHGVKVFGISHHAAHAFSAFATSGFSDAAILVVDGHGSLWPDLSASEQDTCLMTSPPTPEHCEKASLYHAHGTTITPLEKHVDPPSRYRRSGGKPHSFGSLFTLAAGLIFNQGTEAGKVMGLAPYGKPEIPTREFFEIVDGRFVYSGEGWSRFFNLEPWPANEDEWKVLAASVQAALEDGILYLAKRLRELSSSDNLCYAGGVALNSVANERLCREGGFANVYIIPAAEDSGVSIGAAYHGLWQLTQTNTRRKLVHDAMGKEYQDAEIENAIAAAPALISQRSPDGVQAAADLICAGKIIGWFDGRSELGPRSLGQRSILCDPRAPQMKDILNARVKHREGFRPFAPVVPLEDVASWFEIDPRASAESPFMLRVLQFKPDAARKVPAVVHVDGTGRVQTVTKAANGRLFELVEEIAKRTDVPILLNTSFNVAGEPIVETPEEALLCLLATELDACVLGDHVVTKPQGYRSLLDLCPRLGAVTSVGLEAFFGEEKVISSGTFEVSIPRRDAHRVTSAEVLDLIDRMHRVPARPEVELKVRVATRWGMVTRTFERQILEVLKLLDGKTRGWDLLERLPAPLQHLSNERDFTRLLTMLARYSVVSFTAEHSVGKTSAT